MNCLVKRYKDRYMDKMVCSKYKDRQIDRQNGSELVQIDINIDREDRIVFSMNIKTERETQSVRLDIKKDRETELVGPDMY